MACRRAKSSEYRFLDRSPVYPLSEGSILKRRILRVSKPGLTLFRFSSVRTSRPAPERAKIASATCATTSQLPKLNDSVRDGLAARQIPSDEWKIAPASGRQRWRRLLREPCLLRSSGWSGELKTVRAIR